MLQHQVTEAWYSVALGSRKLSKHNLKCQHTFYTPNLFIFVHVFLACLRDGNLKLWDILPLEGGREGEGQHNNGSSRRGSRDSPRWAASLSTRGEAAAAVEPTTFSVEHATSNTSTNRGDPPSPPLPILWCSRCPVSCASSMRWVRLDPPLLHWMVDAMHDVVVDSVRLGREGLIGNNLTGNCFCMELAR